MRTAFVHVQAGAKEGHRVEADDDKEEKEEVSSPSSVVTDDLLEVIRATKGFMPEDEGMALVAAACVAQGDGPMLEVGAYCGKSAIYLGAAARSVGTVLFSLDHHRGSEENQAGWEHHDLEVVDPLTGRMDTLPFFRRAIERAGLEADVVALVGHSLPVARAWQIPLRFLFIDGGHGRKPAQDDYEYWVPHVAIDGLLAIHDVFENPAEGGRPPYEDIYLPALSSGCFVEEADLRCGSLRVLRRIA